MLEELIVKNLGIIENVSLEFDGAGCYVLSGESGAGKTLTLNALNLLKGKRGGSSLVMSGAKQASVESFWNVNNVLQDNSFKEMLTNFGVDFNDEIDELLVSRIINKNGKSKAMLDGNRTTTTQLSKITPFLFSIHGQSDQTKLQNPTEQLAMLDVYAGKDFTEIYEKYVKSYNKWRKVKKEYEDVKTNSATKKREIIVLKSFIKDFENLNPAVDEDVILQKEIDVLSNLDIIKENLNSCLQLIDADDFEMPSLESQFKIILENLSNLSKFDEKLADLSDESHDVFKKMQKLFNKIVSYSENIDTDALQKLYATEERLENIKILVKKYGSSLNDVILQYENVNDELKELEKYDIPLEKFEQKAEKFFNETLFLSEQLFKVRVKYAKSLMNKINIELSGLAMEDTKFIVNVENSSNLTKTGGDTVSFKIAQHGLKPVEISKGASGGELSRIMLAVELVLAENIPEHCFIFDEIDSGTGGKTSIEIGKRLAKLGKRHQVIVVTHLPQVAAFADKHYKIVKNVINDKTVTEIELLKNESKVAEINRMLSGLTDSASGELHAKELLQFAKEYKNGV